MIGKHGLELGVKKPLFSDELAEVSLSVDCVSPALGSTECNYIKLEIINNETKRAEKKKSVHCDSM